MNVNAADPFVLYDKNEKCFYCYATSNELAPKDKAFFIYKSFDGSNFEFVGYALDLNHKNIWGSTWFWAPEVYYNENNGYYYMLYSACLKKELVKEFFYDDNYEETCKIGVAVSKFPSGPFVNITNRPIDYFPYDKNYKDIEKVSNDIFNLKDDNLLKDVKSGIHFPIIDASLFFKDDRIFLFYSRCCYKNCLFDKKLNRFVEESNIALVELNNDFWFTKELIMPKIKDEYKYFNLKDNQRQDRYLDVINYKKEPQEWENAHINDYFKTNGANKNRRWSEGSTTFKVKNLDLYAILYSCNFYQNKNYGVGIAFSNDGINDFKKYKSNPIIHQIKEDSLYSTGHGSLVTLDDKMYYYFHGRDSLTANRSLYRCELCINSIDDVKVSNIFHCNLLK